MNIILEKENNMKTLRRTVPGSGSAETTLHEPVTEAIHHEFVKAHRKNTTKPGPSINNGSERQCVT